ncbi:succinate--CoA ligase subunit beta, partial [Flavobacteriaceae bacterium]|nr:succinate--CoA ligase subunit beta [Flavobacteriaceae bacterium]
MNLHEYQGKEILAQHGVNVQRGVVLDDLNEIENVSKKLVEETGTDWFVVKAQIHAGGRGKGGGVKIAKSKDDLKDVVSSILGMNLITPQTSKEGKLVRKVLIAEDVYYPGESETEEFYVSILLNRKTGKNMIMYSTEGGVDIESVAEKTPELIYYEDIDPLLGILPFQARKIAFNLGLSGKSFKEMVKFISLLYKSYVSSDSSLFEINPVLKTSDNKIMAVDAKVTLDDNALF